MRPSRTGQVGRRPRLAEVIERGQKVKIDKTRSHMSGEAILDAQNIKKNISIVSAAQIDFDQTISTETISKDRQPLLSANPSKSENPFQYSQFVQQMKNQGLDSNFKRLNRTPPKFVKGRQAKTQPKPMPK